MLEMEMIKQESASYIETEMENLLAITQEYNYRLNNLLENTNKKLDK